jgi:multidrug efflux pump subunit AcrA (membrane-fusion protein)
MKSSKSTTALLIAGMAMFGCGKGKHEEEAIPSVPVVKVAKAGQQSIDIVIAAPATIFAREQSNVAARITAPIRALRVKKGDTVKAGEVLAILNNRDAAAQLADSRAQVADSEAALERVRSGTVPADLERARGQLEIARAALNQAQKTLDRRTQLFNQGAIPNRELLQSQTDLAQAQTSFDVAKRSLELMQNQTSGRDIRSAQARLDSARARFDLAETQLQFAEIRAPFAGTITDQTMYPGDMANPGSPMFQIMDLSVVNARAQVPETAAQNVRQGQPCIFTPSDVTAGAAPGRIITITQAVDPQRRTIEVWCQIPNAAAKLQGNVFGSVSIVSGHLQNATVIPVTAVQFKEGTRSGTVLVVDDKMIGHLRDVQTGEIAGSVVPILNGLQPGETVVVEGSYGLPDKTQLQIAKGGTPKQ